ncbi:MAG: sodium/proton-translocating pyrophosphatase, partial [Bryobacteraceae bacterium]
MQADSFSALALWLQATPGSGYLHLVLGISLLSLLVAVLFSRYVLRQDTGTAAMQRISNAIRQGAEAFLHRQYKTIISLAIVLALIIFVGYFFGKGQSTLAIRMTISFIAGSLCSLAAGYFGMWVSIRANIRTASAARSDLNRALQIALRGGAVTGLGMVALSLLGVGGLFWLFDGLNNPHQVPFQI